MLDDDADGTLPNSLTFTFTGADATGPKTITEILPVTGWTLTSLVCSKGTTNPATGLASIALLPGDAVTCTYTNTLQAATITVTKDAVPNDPQDFTFTTTGSGGGALFASGSFLLDDDADGTLPASRTFTFTGADATGPKTITETLPVTGWDLTALVCSKGTTNPATGLASIALLPGDAVTCTYTNTKDATLDIEKTTVGGTATFDFTGSGTGVPATFTRDTAVANPTTSAPFAFNATQLGTKDGDRDRACRLDAHEHRLHRQPRRADHRPHRERLLPDRRQRRLRSG